MRKVGAVISVLCLDSLIDVFFVLTAVRPITLTLSDANDNNFFTHQARLQIEARMALAQAKDMAHMQMEVNAGLHEKSVT